MRSYLIIAAGFALCLFGIYTAIKALQGVAYREGRLAAINAQQSTDLAHIVQWAENQQKINKQVLKGMEGLSAFKDSGAGPATHYAFERVREVRKPSTGDN